MMKPNLIAKSKREQLLQKKTRKQDKSNRKEVRVIDLDSDLDQSKEAQHVSRQVIDVEKQITNIECPPSQLYVPKPQEFNRFNYSKLTKIIPQIVVEENLFPKELGVVVDEGKIDDKERDAYKAYTFHLQGSKQQHNIRKILLKDRSLLPQPRTTEPQEEEPSKEIKETKEPQLEKDDELAQKKNRYFEISHEMCFRCGKEGHYAKNCVEEDNRACKTCFSKSHDERSCPQVCYECGGVGHISSECPQSRRDRCERCQKRGHSADHCGVILNDKANMTRLDDFFLESDLKKIKCIVEDSELHQKSTGHHFNCFTYKDWPMPYHQLRKGNKKNVLTGVYLDSAGKDRVRLDNSYGSGSDRAYNHYRDRFQRQFRGQEQRWGQNRSFSQSERWERGQAPPSKNQRNGWGSKNKNRSKYY